MQMINIHREINITQTPDVCSHEVLSPHMEPRIQIHAILLLTASSVNYGRLKNPSVCVCVLKMTGISGPLLNRGAM